MNFKRRSVFPRGSPRSGHRPWEGFEEYFSAASNAAESLLIEPPENPMLGFYTLRFAAMIAAKTIGFEPCLSTPPCVSS